MADLRAGVRLSRRFIRGLVLAWVLSSGGARAAENPEIGLKTGVRLGYGFPVGSFERGTHVGDLSYGTGLFALDATYKVAPRIWGGVLLGYGVAIPKLCESPSDCKASLGSDVVLGLIGQFDLPRAGPVAFGAEAGAGYAWYTRRMSDAGIESVRSYRGPIGVLGGEAALEFASTWRIGLLVELLGGVVTSTKLEAPGVSRQDSADGPTFSGMFVIGPRLSKSW